MPNVNQSVGELPKPATRYVSRALAATRSGVDLINGKEEVYFGQNLVPSLSDGPAWIDVGDTVAVISRAAERNFRPL